MTLATGAGAAGWVEEAKPINLLWPLHEANENTIRTRLKKMFTREIAPL
jgi:hypothetical protein